MKLQWILAVAIGTAVAASAQNLPKLQVSENHRFLVQVPGNKPFFWLGDTAWEIFHRLDRDEATHYLTDRARKGYTVIQAVALAEFDGIDTPNAYGHRPLLNQNPLTPDPTGYWDHVDFIVRKANSLGMYVGLLPTWGDKWNKAWGTGPVVFTAPDIAEKYGEWIGQRYRDAGVVWILGGDRQAETEQHREIIRAMAKGLRRGDGGAHLMTFHPSGGRGSADVFHSEEWLDFNMRQNGHGGEFTGRYDKTKFDYDRKPIKPVLDAEPVYEDHPLSFKALELGHSIASDVRRAMYWDLFSGAFGHTYGHHSLWQVWSPGKFKPVNNPLIAWKDALNQPGSMQMQYGRWLIQSRPFLTRIPDDSLIVEDAIPTKMPGAGRYRFVATRDSDGTYAMIYAPIGRSFKVRMDKVRGAKVTAWWFDPRTGSATKLETFDNPRTEKEFTPPNPGEVLDFILVLDDESKRYPAPGTRSK
jgi:hypothetical protein